MYVWNASENDIRAAAEASGVVIFADWAGGGITREGHALRFRLALGNERQQEGWEERERDDSGKLKPRRLHPLTWQRRTAHYGWGDSERRVAAVCWHGHYAFMRYVFALEPDARIKTAFADYRGLDSFLDRAPSTGYRNIGSMMYPVSMREACFCSDYGNDSLSSIDAAADEWAAAMIDKVAVSAARAFNDPAAECCDRDAADCDCRVSIIGGRVSA